MKQGDIIKVNGIDLLVLDIINGNPFVLNITTNFSNINNDYNNSILRGRVDQWFKKILYNIYRVKESSSLKHSLRRNINERRDMV